MHIKNVSKFDCDYEILNLILFSFLVIKTGASSLIAYRLCTKNYENWQWLQTSARSVYKNSKPDFVICTHRPLM